MTVCVALQRRAMATWTVWAGAALLALVPPAVIAQGPAAPPREAPGSPIAVPRVKPAPSVTNSPERAIAARPRGGSVLDAAVQEASRFFRAGRADEGIERLRAYHEEHPDDVNGIDVLGSALESHGRAGEAIALYREAADRLPKSGLILQQLERLYRSSQQWDAALEVCLEYLDRIGDDDGWVADEIESLIRGDRLGSKAASALTAAAAKQPENARLRELQVVAWMHLGEGRKAVEAAAELDRKREARGAVLLKTAILAQDKRDHETALLALDRLAGLEARSRIAEEAAFRRGEVLRSLGRHREAVEAFAEVAAKGGAHATQARMERARTLERDLRQPEEALLAYRDVLQSSPSGRAGAKQRDEARLAIASCHLLMGRPGEAAEAYRALADSSAEESARMEALYQTGEMLFYQGKMQEAEQVWYQLADLNPKSLWVNDALERILLIGENGGGGGSVPLAAFAQAEYQRRLGRIEDALKLVDEALRAHPDSPVVDDLWWERTVLLLDLGRRAEAKAAADTLAARFPEGRRAPNAWLRVADELARTEAGESEAQALYMELLLLFPESLEVEQARTSLQRLKQRTRDSSQRLPGSRQRDGHAAREAAGDPLAGVCRDAGCPQPEGHAAREAAGDLIPGALRGAGRPQES